MFEATSIKRLNNIEVMAGLLKQEASVGGEYERISLLVQLIEFEVARIRTIQDAMFEYGYRSTNDSSLCGHKTCS